MVALFGLLQRMTMSTFDSTDYNQTNAAKEPIGKKIGYALVGFDCMGCGQEIEAEEYRFDEIAESVDGGAPKCIDCHPKDHTECVDCNDPVLAEPDRLCPRCNRCWNAHMDLGSGNRGNE